MARTKQKDRKSTTLEARPRSPKPPRPHHVDLDLSRQNFGEKGAAVAIAFLSTFG